MLDFVNTSLIDFSTQFKTDEDCLRYLYDHKWKSGFRCLKCSHTESWGNTPKLGKTCRNCRKSHSVTSNTIFHGLRFPLLKAFYIVFEVVSSTKSLSALQIGRRFNVNRKTAWLIGRKIRESLKSSLTHPIKNDNTEAGGTESIIYVDEFQVGGYEKGLKGKSKESKKRNLIMVVEATSKNKIKRVYGKQIADFSGKELSVLFEKHIEKGSTVITDGWRGYSKMKDNYNIVQDVIGMKKATNPMNRMIQLFKSNIRGTFHKSSYEHIESYFNEFSFKINRSQWKEVLFHSAIMKMLDHAFFTKKMSLVRSSY